MVLVGFLGAFFLAKTKAGRHIYGVGGNEEASRLSGLNITKIKQLDYSVGGLCSALGGLVMLARTNSGQPNGGEGYVMDVGTAVVLGGISMNGGQGRSGMVIVGVLIMGILSNGMTMLGINEFVQKMFVNGESITDEELKELVGHTHVEVIGGVIVGLLTAGLFLLFM